MSRTRVELNIPGFTEFRKSPEMVSILHELAEDIASRATASASERGARYASDSKEMSSRAIASVYTDNAAAMREELKNNTLQKAVRG